MKTVSTGTKIGAAVCIFLIPISMLGYFLYVEKEGLIDFAKREIAGMEYLAAAQQALVASTHATNPEAQTKAADGLIAAENADAGALAVGEQSKALATMLSDASAGKSSGDAVGASLALISAIADNSNITLDPDGDAYFVGDMSVNQAMGVLVQTSALLNAAAQLDAEVSDDHIIAYAKARDGLATSAANLATDVSKAIKNNADGSLKQALGPDAEALATAVASLQTVAQGNDRALLATTAADVENKLQAFVTKNNQAMTRLLEARIAGFHQVIVNRLGTSAAAVLLGMIIFALIIRSLLKAEAMRNEANLRRTTYVQSLTANFESKAQHIAATVAAASTELAQTAELVTSVAKKTSADAQSASVSATNVNGSIQVIAAAVEEMAIASREISQQVIEANRLAHSSKSETEAADGEASALIDATRKVNETVSLISNIAEQINLLALNATIESARAGDAGKGFAVVASEVKNLANQTNRSAGDVNQIISKVDEASSAIVSMLGRIKDSVDSASGASSSMAAAVEEQSVTTNEITRNMQIAARGADEIADKLNEVSESTNLAASSASQVLIAAQELSRQSEALNSEVVEFITAMRAA